MDVEMWTDMTKQRTVDLHTHTHTCMHMCVMHSHKLYLNST